MFNLPLLSCWKFQLWYILYFEKIWLLRPSPPLKFPIALLGGGYGYFLEPHVGSNIVCNVALHVEVFILNVVTRDVGKGQGW